MKILYIVHQFYPMHYTGTEKFLLNLATAMQKLGHNVKVVTYSFYENSEYENSSHGVFVKEFFYKGIPVVAYKQEMPNEDLNWGIKEHGISQFAERILRKEQPDVIHIAHLLRVSEFVFAAQRLSLPYIITLTDFFLICPKCILVTSGQSICFGPRGGEECKQACPEFPEQTIQNRLMLAKKILNGAASVIAPSNFLGELFRREFNDLSHTVIPYGIEYSSIRRSNGTPREKKSRVILYAGQLNYHKGVHILIDAVLRLKNEDVTLRLYGSGPEAAVKQFIAMAGGSSRIKFCGVYNEREIGAIFAAADIVVIPSNWHENNTIVMREAMASHVPCIVSDAGGMTEVIKDGVNGFIFRMGDAVHLRDVLERVFSQPALLQSVRLHLRRYSLTSVEQEAGAYEQQYSKAKK